MSELRDDELDAAAARRAHRRFPHIRTDWSVQGIVTLIVIALGVMRWVTVQEQTSSQLPAINAAIQRNTERLGQAEKDVAALQLTQQYQDEKYAQILAQLADINRKLDDKADKP